MRVSRLSDHDLSRVNGPIGLHPSLTVDVRTQLCSETTITEEEARLIREQRLKRMAEVLEAQGYVVSTADGDEEWSSTDN